MNLEKFLELVFKNPDNISIEYSNINGKESLTVNGLDLTEFDDTSIKEEVALYKKNLEYLDEWIWEIVMDEAASRQFNLKEMDRMLDLDSYTEEEALQAHNTIEVMSDLIKEILEQEIQSLDDMMERF